MAERPVVLFEDVADSCEYRFVDARGLANCRYHDSAIGYCSVDNCPRIDRDGGDSS